LQQKLPKVPGRRVLRQRRYLTGVSLPLLGTSFVQTPALSGVRSIIHFICFLITFYFGFISKPKSTPS
jgi:hypothetical protein